MTRLNQMRILVDAHQDLAWNMLTFSRDYTLSAAETRQREEGSLAVRVNGDTLLGYPDYLRGGVAVVFATLFAAPIRARSGEWDKQTYVDSNHAHRLYSGQLDAYYHLIDRAPDKFRLALTTRDLDDVLSAWSHPDNEKVNPPVGLVPLMEGEDAIGSLDELPEWWERGVRIIGPAWMSTKFCGGTREPGPLTMDGHALLDIMAERGFTLDLSHMDWEAAHEALDIFEGPIIASHSNALRQVKEGDSNRFLTDDLIEEIVEHDGVIGVVPYNRFLVQTWTNSDPRSACPLEMVAAQIDYICQKAGDALHVGIGTDFDGGFGLQHVPAEIDTIADLHKLVPMLAARGYNEGDINAVFGGNWINFLKRSLPST
jgi:membrane dipeptidase